MDKNQFKIALFAECQKKGITINFSEYNEGLTIRLYGPANGISFQFNYKAPYNEDDIVNLVNQLQGINKSIFFFNASLCSLEDFKCLE